MKAFATTPQTYLQGLGPGFAWSSPRWRILLDHSGKWPYRRLFLLEIFLRYLPHQPSNQMDEHHLYFNSSLL